MNNLLLDSQFVNQYPPALLFRQATLENLSPFIEFDPLPERHPDDGVVTNESGMEFVIEGTPGAGLFMTLVEFFPRRRQLINATLQAIG
jgi:hypothetical protein